MADELQPTQIRLALLADIAAGRVCDDDDGTPWLDCGGGERAKIGALVWELERAGWAGQPVGELNWILTDRGREVLEAGAT